MINEIKANETYESFLRLQKKHPNDIYWAGAVSAMRAVLEIDRLEHEKRCDK